MTKTISKALVRLVYNLYGVSEDGSGKIEKGNQHSKEEGLFSHSKEFQLSMLKRPPTGQTKEVYTNTRTRTPFVPNSEYVK